MKINSEYGSPYAEQSVPESGHIIEVMNSSYEVHRLTWVTDNIGYSMNGCFKVRDKLGNVHLVTKSQNSSVIQHWKTVG